MLGINPQQYEVAIIGGGPVGLLLGCLLRANNIRCIVIEKRKAPIQHSRSIGIHPPSLAIFDHIGIAQSFINKGIKVTHGLAYAENEHLGTISFSHCLPPYRFILTLPQYRTEALLADALTQQGSAVLQRGTTLEAITRHSNGVNLQLTKEGACQTITADCLIGCDGKNSTVRRLAGIPFSERAYNDTYIMGDFSDNTDWGPRAAVALCREGVIESFPLAKGIRRWVVKTPAYISEAHRAPIHLAVRRRMGHHLDGTENSMLSSFGVQRGLARTFTAHRLALAGDAAHVLPPIGGQGMNLGWLDAAVLADVLTQTYHASLPLQIALGRYARQQRIVAQKALLRAEYNMRLGRKSNTLIFKKLILRGLTSAPMQPIAAQLFAMQHLYSWPI